MSRILLVDQEIRVHDAVTSVLKPMGHEVTAVLDTEAALQHIEKGPPQVVIAEVEIFGTDLLHKIRKLDSRIYVILTTAFPRKDVAVSALRAGAFDLLLKPLNVKDFVAAINRALSAAGVDGYEAGAKASPDATAPLQFQLSMTGASAKAEALRKQVQAVLQSRVCAPILLQGPTGCGKRELATYLHQVMAGEGGRFCSLDCGELSEAELRSQLLAEGEQVGPVFAEFSGGTILLEHVESMPESLQDDLAAIAKSTVKEVVWIFASDVDLDEAMAAGDFSMKLYFQISGKVIDLPPLKERTKDLREMICAILQHSPSVPEASRHVEFSDDAVTLLEAHDWPANLVELERVVAMAAMESKGTQVGASALRRQLQVAS